MALPETHGPGNHNKADVIVLWLIAGLIVVGGITALIMGVGWGWVALLVGLLIVALS